MAKKISTSSTTKDKVKKVNPKEKGNKVDEDYVNVKYKNDNISSNLDETVEEWDYDMEGKEVDIQELKSEILGRIHKSKSFMEQYYHKKWNELISLYKGMRTKTDQMLNWQNNFTTNKGFALIRQMYANIMGDLYPRKEFWALIPKDYVKDGVDLNKSAKAHKDIMMVQAKDMHLYREIGWSVVDSLNLSFGIIKRGWEFLKEEKKYLDYKSGKIVKIKKIDRISRPFIKSIFPFYFLLDLDCTAIDNAKWCAEYIDNITLKEILEDKSNNIKDELKDLKDYCKTLPDDYILDAWEYRTPNSVCYIVADQFLIKKHTTFYKDNKLPYNITTMFSEQRSPFGLGLLEMTRDNLLYIDKIMNSNADLTDLAVMPIWLLNSNTNIDYNKLELYPNKVFKVDNNDKLANLPMPGPRIEGYKEISEHERYIHGISGNLEQVEGADTATEAKLSAIRAQGKTKEYVKFNREEFLIPFLTAWLNLNQQFLTKEDAIKLLGEKRANDLHLEDNDVDLNVDFEVELTGEASDIDRVLELDKITQFNNAMIAISQLPPEINKEVVITKLVSLFGYEPSEWINKVPNAPQPAEEEAGIDKAEVEKRVMKVKGEVEQIANEQGVPPEQYLTDMANKMQIDIKTLMALMVKEGGLQEFITKMEQTPAMQEQADIQAQNRTTEGV